MNVLHILASGGIGGIETLCKTYALSSKHNNVFVFLWNEGEIADEIRTQGIKTYCLHTSKTKIINSFFQLCEICKNNKVTTIVVHHAAPLAHIYSILIKTIYPNMHVIAYAHGSAEDMCRHNEKKGYRIRRKILKKSLNKVDDIVAISEFVKKSIINFWGLSSNKITVIYNGVDVNNFITKRKTDYSMLKLIYVGRLIEEKGVQNIIEALKQIHGKVEFEFRIVGTGKYEYSLKQLVEKYSLNDSIFFLGNRRDVAKLLADSNIFVHIPNWEEGFGITIIEAMSAGLVCICNKKGAIPEIIDNNKNGLLINDSSELSYILEIIDLEKCQLLQKNARDRAKYFSTDNFCKELDELIDK